MTASNQRTIGAASFRGLARRCLGLALLVVSPWVAAVSCGGAAGVNSGTDTSTNWLRSCSEDVECELGSTCSCGRCTRECSADAECMDYLPTAVCAVASGQCGEITLCMPAPRSELAAQGEALASCTHPEVDYVLTNPASCFGRELAECPPGSEAFFDACGCGCSEAAGYSRQCRDQCELAAGACPDLAFEDMPDYAATLESWGSGSDFAGVAAGECSNGRRFILTANGTTSEARFFTPAGQFLGLSTSTDVITPTCEGQSYWPEPVRCAQATVTVVLNGGFVVADVGQVVRLPWAEGPPGG
jgi:hypothetical protein